jgi:hypothetical protein
MENPMKLIKGAILLAAIAVLAATVGAAGKRSVRMQIDLPNGGTPQIRVYEGEAATIQMNGDGKYGFVPSFAQGSESVVQVVVFDLATTPHKPLGSVEVTVGGEPVESETSPAFSIRVLDVTQ